MCSDGPTVNRKSYFGSALRYCLSWQIGSKRVPDVQAREAGIELG
ncbi:hypothetical protein P6F35_gp52 [Sphingomonas phage vB_StuS_MMDA13]|uniref:Uncharacterized protein n=1 Tax=Sphingomonas phage vB_StuS_MMDA13 TaxID=2686378 RepID=A0A7G3PLY4_9CAUD|nr:hypothetical protein P6F35_gp52 [Sphingomonas phage vB_StuS_MMDA13]QHB80485.1 hypothetical protein MMDA13_gp52 [Sphingomonas phage vB_StuS_MMDA13]